MKRSVFTTGIVMAAASIMAVATVAAAKGPHGNHMTFAQIDSDGNGQITRAELQAIAANRFAAADADGDGFLTKAELEAAAQKRAKQRVETMMERMDADGDGKIALAEMKPRRDPAKMFDRIDSDGDGTVSEAEYDAAHAKRKARHIDQQD